MNAKLPLLLSFTTLAGAWFAVPQVAHADATLNTQNLQLNITNAGTGFGLQVLDRKTNAVLLNQSSISFGAALVTSVKSTVTTANSITLNVGLSNGATAVATYTGLGAGHVRVNLTGPASATSVTQRFVDAGEHYYGTWMNDYAAGKLDNRGITHDFVGKYEQAGGTITEGSRAPFYFTSKNVGIYAQTTARGSYSFASTTGNSTSMSFDGSSLTYDILHASTPKGVLRAYKGVAGGAFVPPDWALDTIVWRDDGHQLQGNATNAQNQVIKDAQAMRQARIPASAIYVDRPFGTGDVGLAGWGNYDFDSSYPNPAQMVSDLKGYGMQLGLWVTNRLANGQLAEAQANAAYKHFSGMTSTPAADLRDPTTFAWFQQKLNAFVNLGVKGYKIDRGGEGEMPDSVNNQMVLLFQQMAVGGLAAKTNDYFNFARDLNDKSRQYAAVWNGDTASTFAGLATSVTNGIRAGLIEFPIYGSDTGGGGVPTQELWSRWVAASAYTPMMELKLGPGRTPWIDYSAQTLAITTKQTQAHHDLIPYVRSNLAVANATGVPVIRAMFLEFPNDPNSAMADTSSQYMYGDSLLVAPVLQSGVTSRLVYLPAGTRWVNYHDKTTVYGGAQIISASAPIDSIPVFVREGAIIPHGDIVKSNQGAADWKPNWSPKLTIDVFPSTNVAASFDYYTDSNFSLISAGYTNPNQFQVLFGDLGIDGDIVLYLGRFSSFDGLQLVTMDGVPLMNGSGYSFDPRLLSLTVPFVDSTNLLVTMVPEPVAFVSFSLMSAFVLLRRPRA